MCVDSVFSVGGTKNEIYGNEVNSSLLLFIIHEVSVFISH